MFHRSVLSTSNIASVTATSTHRHLRLVCQTPQINMAPKATKAAPKRKATAGETSKKPTKAAKVAKDDKPAAVVDGNAIVIEHWCGRCLIIQPPSTMHAANPEACSKHGQTNSSRR